MHIDVATALKLLQKGEVIAIPTDTVYGLAAPMNHSSAVEMIFIIKNRPNDKPLVTLIENVDQILPFVDELPKDFKLLAQSFWPGGLTLVIPIKPEKAIENVHRGLFTAGFRIPNHPLALELISMSGPLVAPSANFSGASPAVNAEEVEGYFGKEFPVLDGGVCPQAIASTILCYQDDVWKVSRLGAIAISTLEDVLGYNLEKAT